MINSERSSPGLLGPIWFVSKVHLEQKLYSNRLKLAKSGKKFKKTINFLFLFVAQQQIGTLCQRLASTLDSKLNADSRSVIRSRKFGWEVGQNGRIRKLVKIHFCRRQKASLAVKGLNRIFFLPKSKIMHPNAYNTTHMRPYPEKQILMVSSPS